MSVISKLDPRTKILLVMLFTVLVFLADKFTVTIGLMLSFFILRLTAGVPFRSVKYFRTLSMLVIFMILMQALLGPGEKYIINPLFPPGFPLLGGMGSLKWDGLILGLTLACRLAALMMLLPILVLTTAPERISAGLAALGFNYRAALVITAAFNLIPLFEEEGRAIMDAQKLRGIRSFEKKGFSGKLKAYSGLALPLVLGAMRKAQLAGIAMDSRALGVYRTRTWLDKPVMKARDFYAIAACVIYSAAVLLMNFIFF